MINLLSSLRVLRDAPQIEPKIIRVAERDVVVSFKRNVRCKRMILRLTSDSAGVTVTLPKRTSVAEAMRFLESSKPWIAQTMSSRKPVIGFTQGQTILFRGAPHVIEAVGGRRGLVTCLDGKIIVPGETAHVSRRLLDWLKAEAKRELSITSLNYATVMGARYRKLTIRDQSSRWGSCSAQGDLSYSWRLILAPLYVLDYVAAHEVAHLKEMNHGPRFWRLVITHCARAKEARNWLRSQGRDLHRYGSR
jgi:predicted metal-dependent hydrolase